MNKKLQAVLLGFSLIASLATYFEASAQVQFIDLDDELVAEGFSDEDIPFAVECGAPGSQFAFVTIRTQGLVAKIDKNTLEVVDIVDGGFPAADFSDSFYAIARDPSSGMLFISQQAGSFDPETGDPLAQALRFDPATNTFAEIDLAVGFVSTGSLIQGVVSSGGFMWFTVTDFGAPFSGLARVDPNTLDVENFDFNDPAVGLGVSAGELTTLNVDSTDPTILLVPDKGEDALHVFSTTSLTVIDTIPLPAGSAPNHVDSDANFKYIALNEENPTGTVTEAGPFSKIARFNKSTGVVDIIINTQAPNSNFGTFTVFVKGDVLVWTDKSGHIGMFDLTNNPPTPDFFDPVTGKPFLTIGGSNDGNHFGCEVENTQDFTFWFASQGSARVGIAPNSKFSVGGVKHATSAGGGGGVSYEDANSPTILSYYWDPKVPNEGNAIAVNANIIDDVGVEKATLYYYGPDEDYRNAKSIATTMLNGEWFGAEIPGKNVKDPMSFWLTAEDAFGNTAKTDIQVVKVKQGSSISSKPSVTNLPAHVLAAIKPKVAYPEAKLEVVSMKSGDGVKSFADTIVVKNVGTKSAENVRIMLSPEIEKSFKLSSSTIKSIEPNANVTIALELNGNPNRNMYNDIVGYTGEIMVMAEHHSPITLPVNIGAEKSSYLSSYMDKIASMAKQRSKISLLNTILSNSIEKSDLEFTTRDGSREINSPSDEIVIKNTSDRTLNNVRIISKLGNAFLLDKYNIPQIAPNGEISIQMIPQMDVSKYSPRDYRGEIIIAPDNGIPKVIPVLIEATPRHDSIDDFEVRVANNNDEITTAVDTIQIKNLGNRTMDSVKVMLSDNLVRIFSLDKDTFKTIAPGEEVTVQVKFNAKDLKTFMQNYDGDIMIVSEHHNMRTIPVKIQWNKMESDHFVIYARNSDVAMANDVVKYLENYYQNVTSAFGTVNYKATIYMTGSTEEMQLLNDHYFYSYANNAIFICSCDNPKGNALQEFIYRAMIMNYPTYYNMKKMEYDNGNWLIDGMAKYMTVKDSNETRYIDAFKTKPTSFEWYGPPTDAKYGATITFFKYLEEKYGENALYRTLYHLGDGTVSNTRCDTIETCAVLWGVYDSNGWDINKKRYTLDVATLTEEWMSHVKEHYDVYMIKQSQN